MVPDDKENETRYKTDMSNNKIIVEGAREHNLKNVDVEIPRGSLTVITGLSGSGKSSLAFDTIYAEGQRRYIVISVEACRAPMWIRSQVCHRSSA